MPFQITQARSRVTKAKPKNPLTKRPRGSSASPQKRGGPLSAKLAADAAKYQSVTEQATSELQDDDDNDSLELEDYGLVSHLEAASTVQNVAQYAQWIHDHMFDEIPQRAGMNSTRIAEVLNYRKNLPPLVTRAHIHALCKSPTATEREIADLIRLGVLRKIEISGRGAGTSGIGECLILTEEWVGLVQQAPSLTEHVKKKYIGLLRSNRGQTTVDLGQFTREEATALTQAGFLTAVTMLNTGSMLKPDSSTLGSLLSLASVGARTVSGSVDAVGGLGAIQDAGGGGTSRSLAQGSAPPLAAMSLVVPSIGPFLKLLAAAREHLTRLLSKKKHQQTTLDLLREQWDGAVDAASTSRRPLGLQGPVLPGRTKKWKQFYGLGFQWVLEECLGTGLVEVFETGSVGRGVRLAS